MLLDIDGNLCGVDYSMTCPALTIYDQSSKQFFYYFYMDNNRRTGRITKNIIGVATPEYSNNEERFANISEWALTLMKHHNVKLVAIEGASYGSTGKLHEIGENMGVLKHNLWKNGIKIRIYSPNTIKKVARNCLPKDQRVDHTGKMIKIDKEKSVDIFFRETGIALWDVFGIKSTSNPLHDISDSYFILKTLIQEY